MNCENCNQELVRRVEQGGLLLRGKAPIMRIKRGQLVVEQRCPSCKHKNQYSPMLIKLVTPSATNHEDSNEGKD